MNRLYLFQFAIHFFYFLFELFSSGFFGLTSLSVDEFQGFFEDDNGEGEHHNQQPIVLVERSGTKDLSKEGNVQDDAVEGHGEEDSDQQPWVSEQTNSQN